MKYIQGLVLVISILIASISHAVTISVNSSIQISNAPANSKWQVDCGIVTGNYSTFTRQFTMNNVGVTTVPVSSIFLVGGEWFCRTSFVQAYGQGPYSAEIPVTITVPVLSVPALTIIP
jgi:hypothetical protein